MTAFTRTNSGLSNLGHFHGCDVVVFTEGGKQSFTKEQVLTGGGNLTSVDIKFWKSVFMAGGFSKKVSFKAVGSKTCSRDICKKIINGEVKNAVVARDRDLDPYLFGLYHSPYILYTKGYSWENDVYGKEAVIEQIESMSLSDEFPEEIIEFVNGAFNEFSSIGRRLARLEIFFRFFGISFLSSLDSDKFIKNNIDFESEVIKSHIERRKRELVRPAFLPFSITEVCPFMDNYGKIVEVVSYKIINYCSRKYFGYRSVAKGMLPAIMIDRFRMELETDNGHYYRKLISDLENAMPTANKMT